MSDLTSDPLEKRVKSSEMKAQFFGYFMWLYRKFDGDFTVMKYASNAGFKVANVFVHNDKENLGRVIIGYNDKEHTKPELWMGTMLAELVPDVTNEGEPVDNKHILLKYTAKEGRRDGYDVPFPDKLL
ncbi:MAG TPA: hypothetical protein VJ110_03490 [Candidatus Nanoarchaeia archaeon]|nr:hypothetical protein [Candidatus Nanoarchaeia archaeon]